MTAVSLRRPTRYGTCCKGYTNCEFLELEARGCQFLQVHIESSVSSEFYAVLRRFGALLRARVVDLGVLLVLLLVLNRRSAWWARGYGRRKLTKVLSGKYVILTIILRHSKCWPGYVSIIASVTGIALRCLHVRASLIKISALTINASSHPTWAKCK